MKSIQALPRRSLQCPGDTRADSSLPGRQEHHAGSRPGGCRCTWQSCGQMILSPGALTLGVTGCAQPGIPHKSRTLEWENQGLGSKPNLSCSSAMRPFKSSLNNSNYYLSSAHFLPGHRLSNVPPWSVRAAVTEYQRLAACTQ